MFIVGSKSRTCVKCDNSWGEKAGRRHEQDGMAVQTGNLDNLRQRTGLGGLCEQSGAAEFPNLEVQLPKIHTEFMSGFETLR